MGMAASQARYLALVARKSNCEYEGQQINQARTVLSNQSANLFNQMLGLSVPVPPSTQDFTKTQYSFKDGVNASTISSWEQLSTSDPDYNYVVTHYYYTDQYTGSQKMLSDPQVQITGKVATAAEIADARLKVSKLEDDLVDQQKLVNDAKDKYDKSVTRINDKKAEIARLENYATTLNATKIEKAAGTENYTVTTSTTAADGSITTNDITYKPYSALTEEEKAKADATIATLANNAGALSKSYVESKDGLYFDTDGNFVYLNDLTSLYGEYTATPEADKATFTAELNSYDDANYTNTYANELAELEGIASTDNLSYVAEQTRLKSMQTELEAAKTDYQEKLNHPKFIGNCELTALASLSSDEEAEIRQIVSDMKAEGITSEITNCYNPEKEEYYGGIYSFKLNGVTYFTTYNDLISSYATGEGINNIDDQQKLAYYNATYVSTKVEKTEKALMETDGAGRFTSVRFADNSVTYALNMETVTDEVAYNDAMNQYYYENAIYDKTIQDINAKTSIIQQQDQQLELRLKQLDTEQKALSTEMEAVKKVVNDNVESSFKTFNG